VFLINLPTVKLMHNTAHLVTTYLKRVHNYLDTSKGSISCVQQSDGFGILISLSSSGKRLLCRGLFIQKCCQTKSYCNTSLVSKRSLSIALKTHTTHNVYMTLRELVIYPSGEHISKLCTRNVSESAALETSLVCSVLYVL
jgi:hypothetical protein